MCKYCILLFIMEGTKAFLYISCFLHWTWKCRCLAMLLLLSFSLNLYARAELLSYELALYFVFEELPYSFPSSLYYLHPSQQWMGYHFLHFSQCLLYLVLLIVTVLLRVRSCIIVGFLLPWWSFSYSEPRFLSYTVGHLIDFWEVPGKVYCPVSSPGLLFLL